MESSIPERSFVKKVCSRYLALSPFPLRAFPRLPSLQFNSLPTFCYLNTWTEARNRRLLNKLLKEASLLPGIHSRSFTDGDLSSKFIFIWWIILSMLYFFCCFMGVMHIQLTATYCSESLWHCRLSLRAFLKLQPHLSSYFARHKLRDKTV